MIKIILIMICVFLLVGCNEESLKESEVISIDEIMTLYENGSLYVDGRPTGYVCYEEGIEEENKSSPQVNVINLIPTGFDIQIDCKWVNNKKHNLDVEFMTEVIDLCKKVFPELWEEDELNNYPNFGSEDDWEYQTFPDTESLRRWEEETTEECDDYFYEGSKKMCRIKTQDNWSVGVNTTNYGGLYFGGYKNSSSFIEIHSNNRTFADATMYDVYMDSDKCVKIDCTQHFEVCYSCRKGTK